MSNFIHTLSAYRLDTPSNYNLQLMNIKQLAEVSEHLSKLAAKEIEPIVPSQGLCFELEQKFLITYSDILILEYTSKWPHFSGSEIYPIDLIGGDGAYLYTYTNSENMWNPAYPYGAKRLDLCSHLATCIDARIIELIDTASTDNGSTNNGNTEEGII